MKVLIEEICLNCVYQNEVLDKISILNKILTNKLTLEKNIFDLISLLKRLILIFKRTAEEKGIYLKLNNLKNLKTLYLKGDNLQLQVVLINFISNAIKFTKKGGIDINLNVIEYENNLIKNDSKNEKKKNYFYKINFIIKDTGCGISKEQIPQLFQYYASFCKNTEGTGNLK